MVSLQKAALLGVCISGGTLIGNHFYLKAYWKSRHPIVLESIELLMRDPAIVRELGPNIRKGKKIDGVLEAGKPWANASFEVNGIINAKVTVVADAKPASEVGENEYATAPYRDYETTMLTLAKYFDSDSMEPQEYRWKIASLSVVIDDWITLEVVNTSDKLHADVIKKEKILEMPPEQQASVGIQRRKSQMNKASYIYWKMILGGIVSLVFGIYLTRLYKKNPVMNSVFFNKSLEVLRTNEVIRSNVGLPLQSFHCLKGSLNYNQTKAEVCYFVFGPLGFAKVNVAGKYDKKKQIWEFSDFLVEKENQVYKIKT